MTEQMEPLEFHSYAGPIAVPAIESRAGVQIEVKRRLAVIDPLEARTLADWLGAAADSIEPQRTEP
jgi:hypothetical protein